MKRELKRIRIENLKQTSELLSKLKEEKNAYESAILNNLFLKSEFTFGYHFLHTNTFRLRLYRKLKKKLPEMIQ